MVKAYGSGSATSSDSNGGSSRKRGLSLTWRGAADWIAAVVLFLAGVAVVANVVFSWKIEGAWMWQKAGLSLWDLWFARGGYWWAFAFYVGFFTVVGLLVGVVNWVHVKARKAPPKPKYGWEDDWEGLLESLLRFRVVLPVFLVAGIVVALLFSKDTAMQFLLVDGFIKSHGLTWWSFTSTVYGDSIRYILAGNYPTGSFLVGNAVVFEFARLLFMVVVPVLVTATLLLLAQAIASSGTGGWSLALIRNILIVVSMWAFYAGILIAPMSMADITLPIYSGWRIITVSGIFAVTLAWMLSSRFLAKSTKRKLAVSIIALGLVLILVAAPFVQATVEYRGLQNWDANKNTFYFPYTVTPHIDYVKWAADLKGIGTVDPNSLTIPAGGENSMFQSIRTVSFSAAKQQMTYAYSTEVGQTWMKLAIETTNDNKDIYGPMIVWSGNHEYWVLPTSPVLPEQTGSSDADIGKRYLYTHSEAILAVDAASGEVVPFSKVFPQVDPNRISMYYGLGGLFSEQGTVYLNIGSWQEAHMKTFTGSKTYDGQPDYVFGEKDKVLGVSERFWYFIWQGNTAFAWGANGQEISVLQHRDVLDRVSQLLIPGLELEKEPSTGHEIPYMVVDPAGNIYYAFTAYIDRAINTPYADTNALGENVNTNGNFRRLFAVILVNAHDGTVKGYRYGDWNENFITQFYSSFYQTWNSELPGWLKGQVRYPKSLANDIMDLYNTYRVDSTDWDSWHKTQNMYDFPVDKSWNYFSNTVDDLRYVPIYYNGTLTYAGVRIVELYQQKSEQWVPRAVAGMYLFFGDGRKAFVPLQSALSLQIILDSITSNTDVMNILTTRKQTNGQTWDAGNLNLYIINGRPIYFLPYYISGSTILSVGMVIAADGTSGISGPPYLLQNPKDPAEIAAAPLRAYSLLMKGAVLSGDVQHIDLIKNELTKAGFEVRTPISAPTANVAYLYANVTFSTSTDWDTVNSTLHHFINDRLTPNDIKVVNVWMSNAGTSRILYVGALVQTAQGIELHIVTIKI